jgi:hypothetical protein
MGESIRRSSTIKREDFETWESLILSDQIGSADLEALLRDNPEFADWYRERAKGRTARAMRRPNMRDAALTLLTLIALVLVFGFELGWFRHLVWR